MADMTGTTMATWLPEQWSQLATITYRSNTVIWPLLDRRWEPELPAGRGDTVNIPSFTQNTSATARSTFGTGASLTFDAVTESQVQLVVNQLAYKAFRIPVEMAVQTMPNYVSLLTDGIGEAIALKMDSDVAGDGSNGFDAFTAIGTDGVDVTDDVILAAETNLNDQFAPMTDRFAVISPATRASLMKIDTYRNSLYGGSVGNMDGSKGAGYLGQIYSMDFYMSGTLEDGVSPGCEPPSAARLRPTPCCPIPTSRS
ncbi:hypothetical protein CMI37_37310, partial [Candidatus Pacearchaeota archaeon]|nr:hypothetical protein [Candidatus Pacearchaeota archaeon]